MLASGGRAVVGFLSRARMDRMSMPADIVTSRTPKEVFGAMAQAGFRDIRIKCPMPATPWNLVITTRRP